MPITIRNPDLDQKLRSLAAETGTPLEALAEDILMRCFAADTALAKLKNRAEHGSVEKLKGVLSKVSNAPADAVDQL